MAQTVLLLIAIVFNDVSTLQASSVPNATEAKAKLLSQLSKLSSDPSLHFLFGQQQRQAKDNDVFKAVGDYPALSGFNFASLTQGDKSKKNTMSALEEAVKR